ncbi:MAG TPA: C4-dicarboxylate transporter DctA [Micropepsaceae bacterium]|jgi:aerobic C4-dicarboxylate transport protein|nr:C4-dicarboxylate transporter DctA [Micropepsaceae bacterium]
MRLARQLWFQVFVAMVAGAGLGYARPDLGAQMQPLGDAFVNLVRMIIPPVIFCTVVHGVASMNDMKRVGRVALKALIWFEAITLIALVFALVVVNVWQPGVGMNVDPAALDASSVRAYTTAAQNQTIAAYLLHIIPTTLFSAFVQGDVLQVLFVSVLFAFALALVGEPGRPVLDIIGRLSQIFFRIVGLIMWVAPLGAFGAIAFTVGRFGAGSLLSLGALIIEFYVVCVLFVFVVLGGVARLMGVSIFRLLYYIREELLIVAATTSSETVLPRLVQKLQALGCEESVVGLVIPTGYSFNLDGTCLYLATAAVFLAQATNTPLSFEQQLVLVAVALLTSKGAAGVAGAAFVVLAGTLASVGTVPVASVALVLGIHRLLAEALTFVNVVGNCIATIVVAKWDNALKTETLYAQIGTGSLRAIPVPKPAE